MTNAHLTRSSRATNARRTPPSRVRACLNSAVEMMQSGIKSFVVDHPINRRACLSNHRLEETAPGFAASARPAAGWARAIVAAFVVIAGVSALDLLVLWIAAGGLIERMPL